MLNSFGLGHCNPIILEKVFPNTEHLIQNDIFIMVCSEICRGVYLQTIINAGCKNAQYN